MNFSFIKRFFVRLKFRRKIKSDESKNVVNSIVKARKLYKELSIKAHPDKHPDKTTVAEEIMQKITSNQHNYTVLLELKKEVEEKLM